MANAWMPGAKVMAASYDGGSMIGTPKKVVWHTVEASYATKASDMAAYLNRQGYSVHLCWNPVTGEIVQMIPANRAGRGLVNKSGGVETNRGGAVVIQIEVVAQASKPFTSDTPLKNLDKVMDWLRSWGVPDVWPAGNPGGSDSYGPNSQRTTSNWAHSGHFSHSQVPENDHWDPGKISTSKILAAGTKTPTKPTTPVPTGTYTVKKGDTLWGLSQDWKVTVAQIKSLNALKTDELSIGQKLKVPGKTATTPKYVNFSDLPSTKIGSKSAIWTAMGKRLVAEGCGKYSQGPGPTLGQADINSYEAWQRKLGYTGDAAKWPPGKTSWDKLKVVKP
jgi:LysM repeat protein